jgi:hypothetical protein
MALKTGLAYKVYVDTADVADPIGGAPAWEELPNQTGGDLNLARADAEANHKGNAGWTDSLTISRSASISFGGFSDPEDTAYLFVVDTKALGVDTDVSINVKIENDDGDTFIGKFAIGDFTESFPFDGIVEYSGTFNNRGAPTITRA